MHYMQAEKSLDSPSESYNCNIEEVKYLLYAELHGTAFD